MTDPPATRIRGRDGGPVAWVAAPARSGARRALLLYAQVVQSYADRSAIPVAAPGLQREIDKRPAQNAAHRPIPRGSSDGTHHDRRDAGSREYRRGHS